MKSSKVVGKGELISWINKTLDLDYRKVEECANGAAFCQIIDAIHPGTVPMSRVNFRAELQDQMFDNYKVLQEAFLKNGIEQYIDVENLSKGKYMAVLEMLQWVYQYYYSFDDLPEYDPNARRHGRAKGRTIPKPNTSRSTASAKKPTTAPAVKTSPTHSSKKLLTASSSKLKAEEMDEPEPPSPVQTPVTPTIDQATKAKIKRLKQERDDFKEQFEEMQQERDFYFDKLRAVEDICQDYQENDVVKQILEVLYKTDESLGFLPPEDAE